MTDDVKLVRFSRRDLEVALAARDARLDEARKERLAEEQVVKVAAAAEQVAAAAAAHRAELERRTLEFVQDRPDEIREMTVRLVKAAIDGAGEGEMAKMVAPLRAEAEEMLIKLSLLERNLVKALGLPGMDPAAELAEAARSAW